MTSRENDLFVKEKAAIVDSRGNFMIVLHFQHIYLKVSDMNTLVDS